MNLNYEDVCMLIDIMEAFGHSEGVTPAERLIYDRLKAYKQEQDELQSMDLNDCGDACKL